MNFSSLFFHFSDLRNLLKCKDSMFPCYFLLNIRVTWLNMVNAPPLITMGLLNLKICQNFVVTKTFLTFFRGITTRGKGAGELQTPPSPPPHPPSNFVVVTMSEIFR